MSSKDTVRDWEASGLLYNVESREHKKTLAMSLDGAARRMKTMSIYTSEERMCFLKGLTFPIVRRLVEKSQFVPITDFTGLMERIQKEFEQFLIDNNLGGSWFFDVEVEFVSDFCEKYVDMF